MAEITGQSPVYKSMDFLYHSISHLLQQHNNSSCTLYNISTTRPPNAWYPGLCIIRSYTMFLYSPLRPRTSRSTNSTTESYELMDLEENGEPQYEERLPRPRRRWTEGQLWVFGCVGVALLGAGLYLWGALRILRFVRLSKNGSAPPSDWPGQHWEVNRVLL